MLRPGTRNLITDVDGILVGNAEDRKALTGVTVVLPEPAAVAAVDVRGGGPGTRETEALNPDCLVERIDAIALSGGSVFGLEAASGVVNSLAAMGKGFEVRGFSVPIVPSAILFDLVRGDKNWGANPPYRDLGAAALGNASRDFELGNAGAGLGAMAGVIKGGLGSCSSVDDNGMQVGALMAVNPVGSTLVPGTKNFWAWALEQDGEFGGFGGPEIEGNLNLDLPLDSRLGQNTTIGVVATNVALTKSEAQRVAIMAHDGLARAIRPVHTPLDGDSIFVISTAKIVREEPRPLVLAEIGAVAADCVARAIARGVYYAEAVEGIPDYREYEPE